MVLPVHCINHPKCGLQEFCQGDPIKCAKLHFLLNGSQSMKTHSDTQEFEVAELAALMARLESKLEVMEKLSEEES